MNRILRIALAAAFLTCFAATGHAQEQAAAGPPKVLIIGRETVKLGKGAAHEKNEAAYAQAMAAGKFPTRYLAATTASGPDEAWFLNGYASFADAQASHQFYASHATLKAQLDKINVQDADYVSDATTIIATYNDKWSYHPEVSLADKHLLEVETIQLRPGRDKDWDDLVNLFLATASKANLTESDVFYEVRYGAPAGTVLIFVPRKSGEDLDATMGTGKAFEDALGEGGRKRWAELIQSAIAEDRADLLVFDPEMSYPPDEFIKANPDFWKPKHAASTAAKAAPAKQTAPAQ